MSDFDNEAPPLDPDDRERVRQALGAPVRERVAVAIEEVERQVATEDLILLLIDSAAGAARAFLDSLVSLMPSADASRKNDTKGDSE
jgi:hypothetical protein